MLVTPKPPRFSFEEGTSLRLILPCKKGWRILFFSIWMAFWYLGEADQIPKVLTGLHAGNVPIFDIVWLLGWTLGGMYFGSWIIWRLLGSEALAVENGRLALRKQIAWIGRTREFDLTKIAALRFRSEHGAGRGYRESRIELDYGAKTYNFASGIEPAEASQLLGLVAKWAPGVRIEKSA